MIQRGSNISEVAVLAACIRSSNVLSLRQSGQGSVTSLIAFEIIHICS